MSDKDREGMAASDEMSKDAADSTNRELANIARMAHACAWRAAARRAQAKAEEGEEGGAEWEAGGREG